MKKYFLKLVLFFIAIALFDVLFGFVCEYMNSHSKGGGIKSRYYVCKESSEDVLIFGSSRAKHHYVPDIIEDSLGMTCYNTGEDGNGIILSYGFLKMITERYTPKVILYDVSSFDVLVDDNVKYLDLMKPYYFEPGIDSIFWEVEPKTRYMMISSFYRYNTTWLRILGSYLHPMTDYPKGYSPKFGKMDYEPEIVTNKKERMEDDVKIKYFDRFINLTKKKGVNLICCVSPIYKPQPSDCYYSRIQQLCEDNGILFWDYIDFEEISNNRDMFQDKTHLNDAGARKYTEDLSNRLYPTLFGSKK